MKQILFRWGKMSRRQKKVLSWWNEKSKYADYNGIICDGAIRSGKTVSMAFSFVPWAMHTFDRENFAMCGKTIASFRRNVLGTLKRQLKARGYTVTEKRTENLVVVSKGDKENLFYIFGGKDESSQNLIQGMTLAGVLLDEVALKSITSHMDIYEKIKQNGVVCKCAETVNFHSEPPEIYNEIANYQVDKFEVFYHLEAIVEE